MSTRTKKLPPLSELKKALSYNPHTGEFTWITKKARCIEAGQTAGTLHKSGYLQLRFDNRVLKCHRLAWYFATGEDPGELLVRNINGDLSDNRIDNLVAVSRADLALLRKTRCDNTIGATGISLEGFRYRAIIQRDGVRYNLGLWPTVQIAAKIYNRKKKELLQVA